MAAIIAPSTVAASFKRRMEAPPRGRLAMASSASVIRHDMVSSSRDCRSTRCGRRVKPVIFLCYIFQSSYREWQAEQFPCSGASRSFDGAANEAVRSRKATCGRSPEIEPHRPERGAHPGSCPDWSRPCGRSGRAARKGGASQHGCGNRDGAWRSPVRFAALCGRDRATASYRCTAPAILACFSGTRRSVSQSRTTERSHQDHRKCSRLGPREHRFETRSRTPVSPEQ